MDLMSVCENMAANLCGNNSSKIEISESDIDHWRLLFGLTRAEAIKEITNWRLDFGRESLSQTAWETIKDSQFVSGFRKESYEYSLARGQRSRLDTSTSTDDTGMYLVRIQEEPTLQTLQDLLNTDKLDVVCGLDDEGNSVQFCYMTAQMKSLLQKRLASSDSIQFRPSFIRVSIARKDLSSASRYPTLGIDSSLPQYRAETSEECFQPAQDEYPVRYFFYGTLADHGVLARVLGIPDENSIEYEPAVVSGAALTSWANKYLGLVDSAAGDKVSGKVYWVRSREEEEALRIYETAKYEVVRCVIHIGSGLDACTGLTFRLI